MSHSSALSTAFLRTIPGLPLEDFHVSNATLASANVHPMLHAPGCGPDWHQPTQRLPATVVLCDCISTARYADAWTHILRATIEVSDLYETVTHLRPTRGWRRRPNPDLCTDLVSALSQLECIDATSDVLVDGHPIGPVGSLSALTAALNDPERMAELDRDRTTLWDLHDQLRTRLREVVELVDEFLPSWDYTAHWGARDRLDDELTVVLTPRRTITEAADILHRFGGRHHELRKRKQAPASLAAALAHGQRVTLAQTPGVWDVTDWVAFLVPAYVARDFPDRPYTAVVPVGTTSAAVEAALHVMRAQPDLLHRFADLVPAAVAAASC